jgi:predicted secreted protein
MARGRVGASARRRWLPAVALCAGLAGLPAWAADPAVAPTAGDASRDNRISFSRSASVEVAKDVLTVTLQATREGPDAAAVQAALKQVLDAALADARRSAQPGALELRTGGFNLSPRYGRDGKPNGWVGQAELTLEGRDTGRVAATAGRLTGLAIVSTGYSLSREAREQHEAALVAQAIQNFQTRAAEIARQFGFTGYALREVSVQTGDADMARPPVVMRSMAVIAADAAAPLPTEAGKGLITATVQGSIQLTR